MSNLSYTLESLDGLEKKLLITIPLDIVQQNYRKSFQKVRSQARVNGFRQGKAAHNIVAKRYDAYIKDEIIQNLVPEYYEKALEEANLIAATQPKFNKLELEQNKPMTFEAVFSAWPDFSLDIEPEIKLAKEEITVTDEEKQNKIDGYLDQAATYEKSSKEKAEEGDRLLLDFKAEVEGEDPFEQKQHAYDLGSKQFYPEIEEALIGLGCNEEKVISFNLPSDEGTSDNVKGKSLVFTCTITEIQDKKKAELNEEFFQRYGKEIKTQDDFNKFIEDQITREKEDAQKTQHRTSIKEQLQNILTFEIPEEVLKNEIEGQKQIIERDKKELSEAEIETEATEKASKNLRFHHFISMKKEKENIQIDDNLVRQRFMFTAQMMQIDPQELARQEYGKQVYQSVYSSMLEEAVLDKIIEKIL